MYDLLVPWLLELTWIGVRVLGFFVILLLCIAYLTYAERKILGAIQLRQGPSLVGPFGLLQPFADALKLMHKESIIPAPASPLLFTLAPILVFSLSLMAWAVIPFDVGWVFADINVGVLYIFAISSLSVYGIIIAGWASNSRYAFLGAMRSAAQMISYELPIGLVMACVLLCAGSLNLSDIVLAQKNMWFIWPLFPMFVVHFISALAETNRAPFDLPEAEAELASGYNVEYSSLSFALFFLGEYGNMLLQSAVITLLFLGGWLPPLDFPILHTIPGILWFMGKIALMLFLFIWVRATLPRYRYDQLMRLSWKVFLPFSLFYVVFVAGILLYNGWLPV